MSTAPRRIIVGMSGASGAIYGVHLLQILKRIGIETHLVISSAAKITLGMETDYKLADIKALADVVYGTDDISASISSGSFRTSGMIVCPCSMRTLAEIACGPTQNLLTRAADVVLKERRRLVIVPRETPYSDIHLENMLRLTRAGAVVLPASPGFYHRPTRIEELVDFVVGRILDHVDVQHSMPRWSGQ